MDTPAGTDALTDAHPPWTDSGGMVDEPTLPGTPEMAWALIGATAGRIHPRAADPVNFWLRKQAKYVIDLLADDDEIDVRPLRKARAQGARATFDALVAIWGADDAYGIIHDLLANAFGGELPT